MQPEQCCLTSEPEFPQPKMETLPKSQDGCEN